MEPNTVYHIGVLIRSGIFLMASQNAGFRQISYDPWRARDINSGTELNEKDT